MSMRAHLVLGQIPKEAAGVHIVDPKAPLMGRADDRTRFEVGSETPRRDDASVDRPVRQTRCGAVEVTHQEQLAATEFAPGLYVAPGEMLRAPFRSDDLSEVALFVMCGDAIALLDDIRGEAAGNGREDRALVLSYEALPGRTESFKASDRVEVAKRDDPEYQLRWESAKRVDADVWHLGQGGCDEIKMVVGGRMMRSSMAARSNDD